MAAFDPNNITYSEEDRFLKFKVLRGFRDRGLPMDQKYLDRIEYEGKIIAHMKYSTYFLIVADLCRFMRESGILFIVRGSGCGSCYVWGLGISHKWLDPIQYNLPFERFLNPSRISMPDLDIDIDDTRRAEVVEYTIQKYGRERVAKIITFGTMGAKAAIKDMARALKIVDHEKIANQINLFIPGGKGTDGKNHRLIDLLKVNEGLQQERVKYPDLFEAAMRVEGKVRNASIHAAGTVITPDRMTRFLPTIFWGNPDDRTADEWFPTTQWDMYDAEERGLLKMDYLGLKTLRVIDRTCKVINIIRQRQGLPADFCIDDIDRRCPKTWKMLAEGRTTCVFQIERTFVQNFARRMALDSHRDPWQMSVLVSIIRPGMMDSGATEQYLRRAGGQEESKPMHPLLEKTLSGNFGLFVFQEDCMWAAVDMAGMSMAEADDLRRAIGKKKPKDMARIKPTFIKGAVAKGVTPEEAEYVWLQMETFGRYGFNNCVSHDTVIERPGRNSSKSLTVGEMYRIKHDSGYADCVGSLSLHKKYKGGYGFGLSMFADGRVRKNRIVDIRPAGKRPVFLLKTECGRSIKVTGNHKFPTPDRGEVVADDIGVGDQLYVREDYEASFKAGSNPYRITRGPRSGGQYDGQGFPTGMENPGFVDGKWAEFQDKRRRRIELTGGHCEVCKQPKERLELHHRDSDRTNQADDNLVLTCPSCHKLDQYKLGRVRRGEKGYPVRVSRVVEKLAMESVETFDVEMAAPTHNFCVDHIVTCNSHAAAYGMVIGWWTAWLKCHHPLPYMMNAINSEAGVGNKEEGYNYKVAEYVEEARALGIKILPPCVRKSVGPCSIDVDKNEIRFGLGLIKRVGVGGVAWIVANSRRANSFKDFVMAGWEVRPNGHGINTPYAKVSKTDYEMLIAAGAMDCYEAGNRDKMLFMLDTVMKMTKKYHEQCGKRAAGKGIHLTPEEVLNRLGDYSPSEDAYPETSLEQRLEAEQAATGCFLSNSPFEPYRVEIRKWCNASISDIREGLVNMSTMVIAGVATKFSTTLIKKGKNVGQEMAFVTFTGMDGATMEATCFNREWAIVKEKHRQGEETLLEKGKVFLASVKRDRDRADQYVLVDLQRLSNLGFDTK